MTDIDELIKEIQKIAEAIAPDINAKPTKVMYRPADIEALGLTHENVVRIIKENTLKEKNNG